MVSNFSSVRSSTQCRLTLMLLHRIAPGCLMMLCDECSHGARDPEHCSMVCVWAVCPAAACCIIGSHICTTYWTGCAYLLATCSLNMVHGPQGARMCWSDFKQHTSQGIGLCCQCTCTAEWSIEASAPSLNSCSPAYTGLLEAGATFQGVACV